MRRLSFMMATAATLIASPAHAEPGVSPIEYTVKKGDSCTTIAGAFYGDVHRVDLVHQLNPSLGAPPHSLRPGQVLLLPPKPSPQPPSPDAKLTRVRNAVEVRAPDPHPGKTNDPLFRGNRVGTKEQSAADLTFRDETQVRLGENTLVVIFGDTQSSSRTSAMETTLVTGNLRARLSELAGARADKPSVATPGGAVVIKNGEAQVSVDAKQATRLAVFSGGSTVTAQRKTVPVAENFGSKVELGRAPTPPKPLPPAPVWTKPPALLALTDEESAEIAGAYAPGTGAGEQAAQFHVQLARGSDFGEVIADVHVPATTVALEARKLPPGNYVARISAIDADAFEGQWGAVASFAVAGLTLVPQPRRHTRVEVRDGALSCAVDSGASQELPIDLDRASVHTLACARGAAAATYRLEPLPLGQVHARAELLWQRDGQGALRVRLTDDDAEPLDGVAVVGEPNGTVDIGEFRSDPAGGYVASLHWRVPPGERRFLVRVAGVRTAETNAVRFKEPPAPPMARRTRLELALAGGGAARAFEQHGLFGVVGVGLARALGPGTGFLGVRGFAERYPAASTDTRLRDGSTAAVRAGVTVVGAALVGGYRFAPPDASIAPYALVAPEIARQSVDLEASSLRSSSAVVGGYGGLGLDLSAGRGGMFVEVGFRSAASVEARRRLLRAPR